MVALRYLLGTEITPDEFKCRNCDRLYHTKNGVAALRRHYESKHQEKLKEILLYYGLDKKNEMTPETPIKQEEPDETEQEEQASADLQNFLQVIGEGGPLENSESMTTPEKLNNQNPNQPSWVPSAKGRSIVWEHIQWSAESKRAACNYCQAEFQIKGGTSALLRHLKTNHPAAINFDPENPPPVVRRRKRKTMEDYTIVTEDTKSYMDNLLETFLHEDMMPRIDEEGSTSPQPPPEQHAEPQNRADSEIDEVIRNLQNETGGQVDPPADENLRKLLGMVEDSGAASGATSGDKGAEPNLVATARLDEEKQVSSSSGPSPAKQQKRKIVDDSQNPIAMMRAMEAPGLNGAKFPSSILSAIHHRRPPPPHPAMMGAPFPTVPPPPHLLNPHLNPHPNQIPIPMPTPGGIKYNAQAVQILDFEAKVVYNQSMHATIAREDAMTTYYRMKSRKMELEIKKLERELGEEQEQEPDEQE